MSPMRLWRTLAAWLVLCGVAAQPLTESLRIPMPPWSLPPWVLATQSDDGGMMWEGGFVVDMWKLLGEEMGLRIEFVAVGENNKESQANFSDEMHSAAYSDAFDGVSWDVVPPVMRPGYVYTLALFNLEDAIILRRKVVPVKYLEVFTPFDDAVWGVLFASVVTGGLFLLLLSISYTDGPLAILSRYPTYVYHTAIALFGGDDFDEYHLPTGGRVFRFGLLFLATMFSATYTANLAAFLVRPKYRVHGPRTFEELKGAKACIWDTTLRLQEYAGSFIAADETLPVHLRIEWAMEQLKAGACEAAIVSRPDAHLGVLDNCETLVLADSFFNPKPLMAIIREDRRDLTVRVNNGILSVTRSPAYAGIVARYMRYTEQCVDSSPDQLSEISVTHMAVPFIVFAVCGVLALLVTAVQHARRASPREGAVQTKEEQQNEVLGKALGAQLTALATKVEALEQQAGPAVRPAYSPPHPQPIPAGAGRGWAPCDALRPQDAAAPPLRRPRSSWVKF
eukprot:TRINITY_DN4062_c0_g1_i3.p1 TRINITY_DN4062_c0_g1~~TRINITY_DN4062_c0_g1_i3.p1  ORF type:complete len:508 (+),score=145.37 TRINITY_DN4062_c0_g1_i3:42-1565(+)